MPNTTGMSCYVFSNSTTQISSALLHLKAVLFFPALIVMTLTLIFAGIILAALILADFQGSPIAILYFNITLTDIIMAFSGITAVLIPYHYFRYQMMALVIQILRSSWSLTVVCMMINRYSLVRGKPGFTILTTKVAIFFIWLYSIVRAYLYYLLSTGGPWGYLNVMLVGAVLNNILQVSVCLPPLAVMVLLILIAYRARQHINTYIRQESLSTQSSIAAVQIEGGLRLLYAFGIVYILGYGLSFVVAVHSLIDLCGYAHVVPRWEGNEKFCEYLLSIVEICNIILNFANSMIIIQSRQIRASLKRMYRATSRLVIRDTTSSSHGKKEGQLLRNSEETAQGPA